MTNKFAKALEKNPLVVIEHMIYIMMIAIGFWGLSPNNESLVIHRLVNELGLYFTVGVYTSYLLAGVIGHISITTMRIEHRINTLKLAFTVFSAAGVSNLVLLQAGGNFHPMTLSLNVLGLLITGIMFLHLRIRQQHGAVGRPKGGYCR